ASSQNGTAACSTNVWTFTPTTALVTDGVYSVTITQSDTAGNTGTSGAQTITVDKTLPVIALTSVNGTTRSFPYLSNATVTAFGGTCGA
ncbi:Ig-like domain-containing protein, partial [Klebsiella pneumoniae]